MKRSFFRKIILTGIMAITIGVTGCSESASQSIVDAAMTASDCDLVSGPTYGTSAYEGSLIDTHYHIPNLSELDSEEVGDGITPLLGDNITISDIVCNLQQDSTAKVFAFFPVFPERQESYLELAQRTMELYPETFVPFIMPPDDDNSPDGSPTVDADRLNEMLTELPETFQGYGEIGLYERDGGAAALPPDSERLQEIYPVIRENRLLVYFHLGRGHKENLESMASENPDISFIFHGDQLSLEEIEAILENHSNVAYTVDELYGGDYLIRAEVTKEEFLAHLENYEILLEEDVTTYKAVIERHPDQFMWGTDRSPEVLWSHDPEVGQALANYGRAFIARLDETVQEKFAYQNAERLITAR